MKLWSLLLCLGWVLAPAAHADKLDVARAWEVDEDGLRQWTEHEATCQRCEGEKKGPCARCEENPKPVCAECETKRIAKCRECAGTGRVLDPLVELVCPYCHGSAFYDCLNCYGKGNYAVEGGGEKGQKCGPCKAKGSFPCLACKGKRRIDALKVSGGPGKAKAKKLREAREDLEEALQRLRRFHPTGSESQDRKAFHKAIDPATKVLPVLKNTKKMLDGAVKALRVSAQYEGYEGWVRQEFGSFQNRTIYHLEHQIALVNLCLDRAVHNEEVAARK